MHGALACTSEMNITMLDTCCLSQGIMHVQRRTATPGEDPRPGGIVWKAMQARLEPDAFARIIYQWGKRKGKVAVEFFLRL